MLKVCQLTDGTYAVFMRGFLNQYTQMDDQSFDTEEEATVYMNEQLDSADFSECEEDDE
jgi:hypothetical protein